MSGNNIGWAVDRMEEGHAVCRPGWNGKRMCIFLSTGINKDYGNGRKTNPHVVMVNARGENQPGWVCSQEDLLAKDWERAP